MTLPPNFWAKTSETDCLIWTGAVNSKGYPCFAVGGVSQLAHRLVWADVNGAIPEGMTVDHTCRVRNCVRLSHLELVTQAENNRRAREAQGYRIGGTCGQGHDLSPSSTRTDNRGRLICLACAREHQRNSIARRSPAGEPTPHEIRDWALEHGVPVSLRGRLSAEVRAAYAAAHVPTFAATG